MPTNTYSYDEWLKGQYDQYVQSQNAGDAVLPVMPYDEFVRQQSGWANLDPSTDLSKLSYSVGVDGNNYSDTLTNQAGGEVANRDYQAEKWSFLNDMLLPALAVGAGGYFGFNALGSALGAGGAAAGAGAAGGAGGLAAADAGLTALGSAWSPSALGITAVTPAATAAEIAALGAGIPGAVGAAGAGAAGAGISTLGGGGSSVTALGSGMSPAALGITPVAPSFSAAEIAALGSGIPGLPASSLVPDLPNLPDVPDYTPQSIPDIPDRTFPNIPDVPGLTPQTNWLQDLVKPIGSAIKPISDAVGGGSNLAALVGAGLGAASGGGTQTSSRDPWGPSQDFLKAVLGDAGSALTNLRQQPYTPQQQTQYSNAYAGLDQARSALPGLLNWSQGAMQRQSTTPSMAQLFGGGLLQQPTAQAGGGLVDDRMQALMARGRGLIG